MKRIIMAAALLAGMMAAAQADTDSWTSNPAWTDAEMDAAVRYCTYTVGPDENGVPTTAAFKRCMAKQGWNSPGPGKTRLG